MSSCLFLISRPSQPVRESFQGPKVLALIHRTSPTTYFVENKCALVAQFPLGAVEGYRCIGGTVTLLGHWEELESPSPSSTHSSSLEHWGWDTKSPENLKYLIHRIFPGFPDLYISIFLSNFLEFWLQVLKWVRKKWDWLDLRWNHCNKSSSRDTVVLFCKPAGEQQWKPHLALGRIQLELEAAQC